MRRYVLLLIAIAADAETLRVLATTDLHGHIYPWDYYNAREAPRGLAKIATLVAEARAGEPNTLLIDCGDTIQGSPLASVYQRGDLRSPEPMMLVMNRLGYDAMVLGNHEFNFGLRNLKHARTSARFPWLAANVNGFDAYVVKRFGGITVAVIGITTPSVPEWEKPENYAGHRFRPAVEAARDAVNEVRRKHNPNVVVVAAHSGISNAHDLPGENAARDIAEKVPGIDAVIFGHTHSELASEIVNGVLMMQPKNWGMSLGVMDFVVEGGRVSRKSSRLVPVRPETPASAEILALAKPHHEAAERYLETPVAESPGIFRSRRRGWRIRRWSTPFTRFNSGSRKRR